MISPLVIVVLWREDRLYIHKCLYVSRFFFVVVDIKGFAEHFEGIEWWASSLAWPVSFRFEKDYWTTLVWIPPWIIFENGYSWRWSVRTVVVKKRWCLLAYLFNGTRPNQALVQHELLCLNCIHEWGLIDVKCQTKCLVHCIHRVVKSIFHDHEVSLRMLSVIFSPTLLSQWDVHRILHPLLSMEVKD